MEEFSFESMRKDVKYHARTKSELQSHVSFLFLEMPSQQTSFLPNECFSFKFQFFNIIN